MSQHFPDAARPIRRFDPWDLILAAVLAMAGLLCLSVPAKAQSDAGPQIEMMGRASRDRPVERAAKTHWTPPSNDAANK